MSKEQESKFYDKFKKNASIDDIKKIDAGLDKMNRGPIAAIWGDVQILYQLIKSPDTAWGSKAAFIASLTYLITPFDAVPDFILLGGLVDDTAVIGLVLKQFADDISNYKSHKAIETKSVDKKDIIEKYNKLKKDGDSEEAYFYLKSQRHILPDLYFAESKEYLADLTADNIDSIHRVRKDVLEFCERGSDFYYEVINYSYNVLKAKTGSSNEPIAIADLITMRKLSHELSVSNSQMPAILKLLDLSRKDFNTFEEEYISRFLDISANKRKLLVPVKDYTTLAQDNIEVIKIDSIPQSVKFPRDHPKVNHLYICHPYRNNVYFPYEEYELMLFEDRINEFFLIAQCLGATHIKVNTSSDTVDLDDSQNKTSIGVGGEYKGYGGDIKLRREREEKLKNRISRNMSIEQTFSAINEPAYLPDNLVWYPNEQRWGQLYKQRTQKGPIERDCIKISTGNNNVIDTQELKGIDASFKMLGVGGANISLELGSGRRSEWQEDVELSIDVEFTPIGQGKDKRNIFQRLFGKKS